MKWCCIFFLSGLLLLSCSKYRRGDVYKHRLEGDTLTYVITSSGSGSKLSDKAHSRKLELEHKGDSCRIMYLTDSVSLNNKKGVLLQNIMLPGMKEDMLTKGYFGTFTSKQLVTILLVSYEDFDRNFKKRSPLN